MLRACIFSECIDFLSWSFTVPTSCHIPRKRIPSNSKVADVTVLWLPRPSPHSATEMQPLVTLPPSHGNVSLLTQCTKRSAYSCSSVPSKPARRCRGEGWKPTEPSSRAPLPQPHVLLLESQRSEKRTTTPTLSQASCLQDMICLRLRRPIKLWDRFSQGNRRVCERRF